MTPPVRFRRQALQKQSEDQDESFVNDGYSIITRSE